MLIDRNRYLTPAEAANKSGYTINHIRRLVKSGAVAVVAIDARKYLIDFDDLQRYLAAKPQRKPHKDTK